MGGESFEKMNNARENYQKDFEANAKEEGGIIKRIFSKEKSTEDFLQENAAKEDKYRDLLSVGQITEEELKLLIDVNLRISEDFSVITDTGIHVIEGVVNGDRVRAVQSSTTPIHEGGFYSSHEVEINGKMLDKQESESVFKQLLQIIQKKECGIGENGNEWRYDFNKR